jgi:hypothetical protein
MAFAPVNAANMGLAIEEQEDEPTHEPFFRKGGFRGFHGFGHRGGFGFGPSIDYDAFLADALDISVAELQDAREAANTAALEQAVAEGYITEEQADLIKARYALAQYIDKDELLAEALDISVEELQAAHEEGKSISTLLDELGLKAADVREAIQVAYEDAVQQAVEDGVISEDQAEQILSGDFGGPMFGGYPGFGGRGRFHGRGGFHTPDTDTNQGSDL